MKLKLNPSAKIKRRYLLIKGGSKNEIEKIIIDYLGILGWAKTNPFFVKGGNEIILAVERSELNNVRAAFEISKSQIKILKVSGTIKGLKK